jgi:hypothetical protein
LAAQQIPLATTLHPWLALPEVTAGGEIKNVKAWQYPSLNNMRSSYKRPRTHYYTYCVLIMTWMQVELCAADRKEQAPVVRYSKRDRVGDFADKCICLIMVTKSHHTKATPAIHQQLPRLQAAMRVTLQKVLLQQVPKAQRGLGHQIVDTALLPFHMSHGVDWVDVSMSNAKHPEPLTLIFDNLRHFNVPISF